MSDRSHRAQREMRQAARRTADCGGVVASVNDDGGVANYTGGLLRPASRMPNAYWRERNRPPPDTPFVWLTDAMVASLAFRSLSRHALMAFFRIALEHMENGGRENGNLIVTFNDLESYGIPRKGIAAAIREAIALGFIELTERGIGGPMGARRRSHKFALTSLPTDTREATNLWKRFTDKTQVMSALSPVRKVRHPPRKRTHS